jgi:hypothetical protein
MRATSQGCALTLNKFSLAGDINESTLSDQAGRPLCNRSGSRINRYTSICAGSGNTNTGS